jgi:hypothetical protein
MSFTVNDALSPAAPPSSAPTTIVSTTKEENDVPGEMETDVVAVASLPEVIELKV